MRTIDLTEERYRALAGFALRAGAERPHVKLLRWDCSGTGSRQCESPYEKHLVGHRGSAPSVGSRGLRIARPDHRVVGTIEMKTRCRRCRPCQKAKAASWAARAALECAASRRVWFVTLTLSPHQRYLHEAQARSVYQRRSDALVAADEWPLPAWDGLAHSRRFQLLSVEVQKTATLWLKRVRKRCPPKALRTVTVVEEHKDGSPHLHLLVFERGAEGTSERTLRGIWRNEMNLGIAEAQLVRDHKEAPWYICKYIAKNAHRIRASIFFGKQRK